MRRAELALAPSGWSVAVILPGDSAAEREAKLQVIEAAKARGRDSVTVWIGGGSPSAETTQP